MWVSLASSDLNLRPSHYRWLVHLKALELQVQIISVASYKLLIIIRGVECKLTTYWYKRGKNLEMSSVSMISLRA